MGYSILNKLKSFDDRGRIIKELRLDRQRVRASKCNFCRQLLPVHKGYHYKQVKGKRVKQGLCTAVVD